MASFNEPDRVPPAPEARHLALGRDHAVLSFAWSTPFLLADKLVARSRFPLRRCESGATNRGNAHLIRH